MTDVGKSSLTNSFKASSITHRWFVQIYGITGKEEIKVTKKIITCFIYVKSNISASTQLNATSFGQL